MTPTNIVAMSLGFSTGEAAVTEKSSLRVVGISGSLRSHSYNSGALRAVAALIPERTTFSIASLVDLPFYSADVERQGLPASVERFRAEVAAADALIFATPEYNLSISGSLKSALEWLSRPPHPPAYGKPCAIFGASVSPLGTARGQFHLRHICVSLNMRPVNVPHVDITVAKSKFDAESKLIDQPSIDSLRHLLGELRTLAIQLRRTDSCNATSL